MNDEVYKVLKYNNKYSVSNKGNIKNNKTNRILKLTKSNRDKYLYTSLLNTVNKVKKISKYFVHKLVAEHFIENKNGFKYVKHLNKNKHDNTIENLYYTNKISNIK